MLDKDLIKRKIAFIARELVALAKYKEMTFEETAQNFETQALVERLLERVITRGIDINKHIIANAAEKTENLEPVIKYRETFLRLADIGVYSREFAEKIAPSAGFRNALVHEYNNIDKKILQKSIKEAIENNRLLIISPFDDSVKRITQETANRRNEIMADLADEIFLAYYTEGGNLHNLIKSIKDKKIVVFD